ncbi:MAG: Hcp family type VI secretion system effector [Candidatus Hodarchaeota archaeon]
MKTNYVIRIVVPLILLVGFAMTFFVAVLNNQQVEASTNLFTSDSTSMNLEIDGFDGESDRPGREGTIDVLSYSHSISAAYSASATRSATSAQHTPLRVTKLVDKTSPKLFEKCSKGTVITSVILSVYHEPDALLYLKVELQNVQVASVLNYGLGDELSTEIVSFTYEQIKWTYTEYGSDGKSKGNVESGWINWGEAAT